MFWDRVASVYDIFVKVINRKTHKKLKRIVRNLIEPCDIVLECACGTGLLSAVIAPKCSQLTATDFSEKMLKKAEKNCRVFRNITYALRFLRNRPNNRAINISFRQFFLQSVAMLDQNGEIQRTFF